MLYFKCPTCRTNLANKELIFEEEMNNITNDPKLSKEQKDKLKIELLDKLQLKRYCCRMRILTYIDNIKIIK